jgi:CheY-like chemotaxis protein
MKASEPVKLRLLVVEDDAIIAMELEDQLRDLGHHVMGVAGSVKQALRLVEELAEQIDAVPPVSGKLSAALLFLYFTGGRDRTMIWDIHRNGNRLC